jgi:serine/threonine-protein kinase RsbW
MEHRNDGAGTGGAVGAIGAACAADVVAAVGAVGAVSAVSAVGAVGAVSTVDSVGVVSPAGAAARTDADAVLDTGAGAGVGMGSGAGDGVTSALEVGVDGVGIGDEAVPVTLRIPADRDFVVLVRSAAGHLGARAGFSMAEMQDWRLAVDEACGLLLLPDEVDATGEELECVFRLGLDGVAVTVSAEARPGSKPQVGGFGWSLLAALVDSLNWAEEDGRVRVDIVKQASGDGGRRAEAR